MLWQDALQRATPRLSTQPRQVRTLPLQEATGRPDVLRAGAWVVRYILPPMATLRSSPCGNFAWLPWLPWLAAALWLGGCAAPPVAKGIKAEYQPPTAEAVQVAVTMELVQPNDGALELIEWDYTATVNGKQVFQGTWAAMLTLPPDLAHANWRVSGSVGYRATRQMDKLLYQLGISRQAASFEASGQGVTPAPLPPPPKKDAAQSGAPGAPGGKP